MFTFYQIFREQRELWQNEKLDNLQISEHTIYACPQLQMPDLTPALNFNHNTQTHAINEQK